jgi:alginate O-acetyltransferase complex protein AlgJ
VEGAGVAANLVAEAIRGDEGLNRAEYVLKTGAEVTHKGDLYKFAKFSVFSPYFPLPGDKIRPLEAIQSDMDLDALLDESSEPEVALVGSSYTANSTWSFEAQLRAKAKVDVSNFAAEGVGPFKPMEDFLNNRLKETSGVKLVIWELPLRYFPASDY